MASPASSQTPLPPPLPISQSQTAVEASESKPEVDNFQDADFAERSEKLKKYEVAYAQRLKAKYFSKKTFHGGDIFDHQTPVDGEIIKSSSWPCTRSYTDPIQIPEDKNRSPSLVAETSSTPSKKSPSKKSS